MKRTSQAVPLAVQRPDPDLVPRESLLRVHLLCRKGCPGRLVTFLEPPAGNPALGSGSGHFPAGSMGPKITAMIDYLSAGGQRGLITNPPNIGRALSGDAGTVLVPD